ncbi:hypothetical protein H0H93_000665 [Arthromyces matolae]|nr:hypothetical protein H0H93_000665 [Arthromyces matolae]
MSSQSKTAEFARLFDFFERLASHKSRPSSEDEKLDDIDALPIPADLAPIINSLSNLANTRISKNETNLQTKTAGRKRAHTVSTTSSREHKEDSEDSNDESVETFPLTKKHVFTFRLMLHKLYQMDDWKQKIKDVLERSQIEYKPLSETMVESPKKEEKQDEKQSRQDRVHFEVGSPREARKSRPRALSTLSVGRNRDTGPHLKSPTKPLKSPPPLSPRTESLRALKKRCIGRRKSVNGPLFLEAGRIGGNWVYDAAISAAEVTGRDEGLNHKEATVGQRQLGYAALGVAGSKQITGKRRVSLGVSGVSAHTAELDSGVLKRRRALSVMDNMAPNQMQRKRPLEL